MTFAYDRADEIALSSSWRTVGIALNWASLSGSYEVSLYLSKGIKEDHRVELTSQEQLTSSNRDVEAPPVCVSASTAR